MLASHVFDTGFPRDGSLKSAMPWYGSEGASEALTESMPCPVVLTYPPVFAMAYEFPVEGVVPGADQALTVSVFDVLLATVAVSVDPPARVTVTVAPDQELAVHDFDVSVNVVAVYLVVTRL